ncbi:hypothetical protein V8D89_012082 [Ganoderma adspersum]
MPPLLAQLQHERNKYRDVLGKVMTKKAGVEVELQELQSVKSVSGLQDASYIAEQSSGKLCILALRPIDVHNVEEAVLRVQGFVIDSITLTGLGTVGFDDAVRGMQTIYQVFSNHVSRAGSHLRTWTPGRDGQDLTLTFANRYLTSNCDVGNETSTDPSVIDPFNILRPLIKNEVHTADNVVEYWEHREKDNSEIYVESKPGIFAVTNLVEAQVSFAIIRVARQEYVFVPKLRAICLLDCVVETLSLLKKVKRKVGYGRSHSDDSGNEDVLPPPNKQLRSLILGGPASKVDRTDVSMKEVA